MVGPVSDYELRHGKQSEQHVAFLIVMLRGHRFIVRDHTGLASRDGMAGHIERMLVKFYDEQCGGKTGKESFHQ